MCSARPSKSFGEWLARGRRIREKKVVEVVDGFNACQLAEREISLRTRGMRLNQGTYQAGHRGD
jgi:hypothetical protein